VARRGSRLVRKGDGGSVWRSSPACQCSGAWGALQATLTGLKGRAGGGGPHRGSSRAARVCRGVNVDGGRRRRNGVGEETMWWCSEPADPPNRSVRVLRRFQGGSERSGIAGGEKSGRRADIPAATSGTIPAAAGAVVEDGGREVDPGARGELLRGFSEAEAWPGCWTTAAQSYGVAEQGGQR